MERVATTFIAPALHKVPTNFGGTFPPGMAGSSLEQSLAECEHGCAVPKEVDRLLRERLQGRSQVRKHLSLCAKVGQYDPAEHPRDRARQYDKAQRGEPTPAKTKRKA
jgi:hypothetical protein